MHAAARRIPAVVNAGIERNAEVILLLPVQCWRLNQCAAFWVGCRVVPDCCDHVVSALLFHGPVVAGLQSLFGLWRVGARPLPRVAGSKSSSRIWRWRRNREGPVRRGACSPPRAPAFPGLRHFALAATNGPGSRPAVPEVSDGLPGEHAGAFWAACLPGPERSRVRGMWDRSLRLIRSPPGRDWCR